MCLAVPGKILSIIGEDTLKMAEVDFLGIKRMVCISTVDAEVGDYVIVHAGTALSVINPKDAVETIKDLEILASFDEK